MNSCDCRARHALRRVVLTGGPGAGKTAILELVQLTFCEHVRVLPEAAGIVYGGGFPRDGHVEMRRASQRAIFYVQRELERGAEEEDSALLLCDRGTVDGGAYWPGPGEIWTSVGTTLAEQLRRYDTVIQVRTPAAGGGYDRHNPLRTETAAEAATLDDRIALLWEHHPRRHEVPASADFIGKAAQTLAQLRDLVPTCCRPRVVPLVDASYAAPAAISRP